ncbi:MAG: hypothetical protein RJA70_331, partial [Pseudomonadota bacterium]
MFARVGGRTAPAEGAQALGVNSAQQKWSRLLLYSVSDGALTRKEEGREVSLGT